jgi:hypothetical protein
LRAEQNADTYLTTDWIAHNADAEKFLQGNDSYGVAVNPPYQDIHYPTDVFQNVESSENGYLPIQGETPVARKLFYGVKPAEQIPQQPESIGFIGIVDLPTAQRYGLPVAKLVNASGNAVAPDAAGIAAGYKAMKTNPDGITKVTDYTSTDPAAYPLVKIDYAMLPTVARDAAQQASLKRLLAFVAAGGQTDLPPGYAALGPELLAQITAAAGKITVAPPTPTATVPTTTVPTTTPPVGDLGGVVGGGFNNGTSDGSTPTTTPTSSPSTTTPKPASAKKVSHSAPVVGIANAGERFGLPIVVALALLGGLYPLSRRVRVFSGKAFAVLKARLRRPIKTPAASSAS